MGATAIVRVELKNGSFHEGGEKREEREGEKREEREQSEQIMQSMHLSPCALIRILNVYGNATPLC